VQHPANTGCGLQLLHAVLSAELGQLALLARGLLRRLHPWARGSLGMGWLASQWLGLCCCGARALAYCEPPQVEVLRCRPG